MLLGLDCGTKTGWCLLKDGRIFESGVQDFSKRRGESNGAIFLRFRHWLAGLIDRDDVYLVVYEAAHHRGGPATEIAVNMTGRVQELCAGVDTEYASAHSSTVKKFATGKGNANKRAMVHRASVLLGREPEDDNEADAIFVGLWAFHEYGVD